LNGNTAESIVSVVSRARASGSGHHADEASSASQTQVRNNVAQKHQASLPSVVARMISIPCSIAL
jgi:hypothetical protein